MTTDLVAKKMRGSAIPLPGKCGGQIKHCMEREGMLRYCTIKSGQGTSHLGIGKCKLHGGATPNHIVSAERIKANNSALEMLQEMGRPAPIGNPIDELFEVTALIIQWKDVCVQKVKELETFDIAHSSTRPEQIKAVIELFERGIERARDTLISLEKLNLEQKRIDLKANQGTLIAETISKIIMNQSLGLSDDQIDKARHLFSDAFSQIFADDNIEDAEIVEDDD